MLKHWKSLLLSFAIVVAGFSYVELPGIRYCEPNDFPSVIAVRLETKIKETNSLNSTQPLPVMRGWDWRWGRYGAGLQIWGIDTQWQQDTILNHLKQIKAESGSHRFINVEFMHGLPGKNDCRSLGGTRI